LKDQEVAEGVFLDFLETMVNKKDMSTSTLLIIRSAISSLFRIVFSKAFGQNYQAQLMAKNMRNEKPRQLKHKKVFEISLLLDQYRDMPDNADLSDQDLQAKLATMLILFIQLRPQDMLRIDMSQLEETEEGLFFGSIIKNAPEFSECVLSVVQEDKVCPVRALLELKNRVCAKHEEAVQLFWNEDYSEPLSKVQLEKNMKRLMIQAGIPVEYTPYSIKHAAITHLLGNGVQEWMVNKNARLSQFSNTAAKHYFIGQANQIVSREIAAVGRRPRKESLVPKRTVQSKAKQVVKKDSPEDIDTDQAQVQQDSQLLTQLWLDNMPQGIPPQSFTFTKEDERNMERIPSEVYEETEEDWPLFMSVCSVLSSFASDARSEAHRPSGHRESDRSGRGQLAGSVRSSRTGSKSHSPDRPPKSPNSGSLSQ
jgi:site-specific recombinase XerD